MAIAAVFGSDVQTWATPVRRGHISLVMDETGDESNAFGFDSHSASFNDEPPGVLKGCEKTVAARGREEWRERGVGMRRRV